MSCVQCTVQLVQLFISLSFLGSTHSSTLLSFSRRWREEQQERLATKDAEETAALDEMRAQSRKDVADWYSRHDDQVGQTKNSNRYMVWYIL